MGCPVTGDPLVEVAVLLVLWVGMVRAVLRWRDAPGWLVSEHPVLDPGYRIVPAPPYDWEVDDV